MSVAMMIIFTDCGGAHTRTLDSRLDSRVGYTECTAWVTIERYMLLAERNESVLVENTCEIRRLR